MLVEVLLVLGALLVWAVFRDRKPSNMPPGPREIPFIGNGPPQTVAVLEKYRRRYGDLYTTRLGNTRFVVVSDYKLAKESMSSAVFADRPQYLRRIHIKPEEKAGVSFENGPQWVHDRRFLSRNLRDLGMGKTRLEQAVQSECQVMVDDIKSLNNKSSPYPKSIRTTVLNTIWQMVAGKRYDPDGKEMDKIFAIFAAFRDKTTGIFMESFFPVLSYMPNSLKNYLFESDLLTIFNEEMRQLLEERIVEHEQNLDEDNPQDLIDEYLLALKKPDSNGFLRRNALYQMMSDLFSAGSDPMANTLRFVILYMIRYPEEKEKCQQQLDEVVPFGELTSLHHRQQLPQVDAFMAELLRHTSLAFMSLPRMAHKDTTLGGYFIPKGTVLNVNTYFLHHDPSYWEDPEEFRPARFLDEDGQFTPKPSHMFAFGSGRRLCVGESLARMEIFLFTAALLQNFDIELPPGKALDMSLPENVLFSRFPAEQNFIYRARS